MQSTMRWCLNEGSMLKSLKVGHPPVPFSCGSFYGAGGIAVRTRLFVRGCTLPVSTEWGST